jgi:hypothetical protein
MARSAFERAIELSLSRFSPEEAKKLHIEIARRVLADFLASQEEKPEIQIWVDGQLVGSEESVRPFGRIEYRILRMPQIARYGIVTARGISPVDSGRYRRSWFLLVDGVETAENSVAPTAREIIITNDQPYARKIEVRGARRAAVPVPPGIVERLRQLILRKYGGQVVVTIRYLELRGGYVLKRPRGRRRRRGPQQVNYPALVLTPRV